MQAQLSSLLRQKKQCRDIAISDFVFRHCRGLVATIAVVSSVLAFSLFVVTKSMNLMTYMQLLCLHPLL